MIGAHDRNSGFFLSLLPFQTFDLISASSRFRSPDSLQHSCPPGQGSFLSFRCWFHASIASLTSQISSMRTESVRNIKLRPGLRYLSPECQLRIAGACKLRSRISCLTNVLSCHDSVCNALFVLSRNSFLDPPIVLAECSLGRDI